MGIMPDFLSDIERTSYEINHVIVKDMHARKMMMYDKSDAFIVLPGGIGTLEEAVEVLSWSRLNLHNKPIIFLDNTNYWASILKLLRLITGLRLIHLQELPLKWERWWLMHLVEI